MLSQQISTRTQAAGQVCSTVAIILHCVLCSRQAYSVKGPACLPNCGETPHSKSMRRLSLLLLLCYSLADMAGAAGRDSGGMEEESGEEANSALEDTLSCGLCGFIQGGEAHLCTEVGKRQTPTEQVFTHYSHRATTSSAAGARAQPTASVPTKLVRVAS